MTDKTKSELAAEERNRIPVVSVLKNDEGEVIPDKEKKKEETEEETEEEVKDDDKKKEETEETEEETDKDEDEDEDEEGEEETEGEKKEAKKEETAEEARIRRMKERTQKRINKANAEAKAAKEEVARLTEQLAANPDKKLTEAEVETLAEAKANEKALQRQFVDDCNRLADGAEKVDKDFQKKVNTLTDELGPIPGSMIAVLTDLDNGAQILSHLTQEDNIELAEELFALNKPMDATKLATKLAKLSVTLATPPRKELSKVSPAKKGLGGKSSAETKVDLTNPKLDMRDWVQERNKQVAERAKLKAAGMLR